MFSYINFDKICLTAKGDFSQNVAKNFKVFEINELSSYLVTQSLEMLKNKYRPKKKYIHNISGILEYKHHQIYLNPYSQVLKIIKYSKKILEKMKVYQVYYNSRKKCTLCDNTYEYANLMNKRFYYYLEWIYPYRNSIYFDEIKIGKNNVDVTQLDPRYLEYIYELPRHQHYKQYNKRVDKESNMDQNHPFFKLFRDNVVKFHDYLLEYQMILPFHILELCQKYIQNYIIDYTNTIQKKIKDVNITYYLNSFDKQFKIKYTTEDVNNRITYLKSISNDYHIKTRCEYKFSHILAFEPVEKNNVTSIETILIEVKSYYGIVLNFGNHFYFDVPYMDFLDDYRLVYRD